MDACAQAGDELARVPDDVSVSDTAWLDTRHEMGAARDRESALDVLGLAGYTPLEWQARFHLHDCEDLRVNKYAVCGLGSGKSEVEVHEGAICAMLNPGAWGVFVAPTYDQLKSVLLPRWQDLMERLAQAGTPLSRKFHLTEMYDELWCGGRVYFRSLSKVHNLRGFEFAWVGGDELESVINAMLVWDVLSGRVRQKAYFREMFGGSTPRGLQGIVQVFVTARAAVRGRIPSNDNIQAANDNVTEGLRQWFTIRATSEDNPHLPPDYLAVQRATYSKRRWDEEVLAKILKPETAVWGEIDAGIHVIDWPRPWVSQRDGRYVANPKLDKSLPWDLAYDAGDATPHVLWIQRLLDGSCIVLDEFCEDQMPLGQLHELVLARSVLFGRQPAMAACDRARKDERAWLAHAFPMTDIRWMRSQEQQSILPGVEIVRERLDPVSGGRPKLFFARHLTVNPPRRGIWNCMRNYRYGRRADGTLTAEPYKDNIHDHGADALRMHQVAIFGSGATEVISVPRRYHQADESRLRRLAS